MKLIGPELGRAVVMTTPEEWRSRSISMPDAFRLIQERYQFAHAPNLSVSFEEVQKSGFKFGLGKLRVNDTTIPIQELALFNDGIVVNAMTTDNAEAFLMDLFRWANEIAGIRDLTNVGRRLFVSQLIVEFEKPVNQLINGFKEFTLILNQLLQATYKVDLSMQLRTLNFHYDQLAVPEWIRVTHFTIDRRVGHLYDENRFFSEAPFRTADHLQALEALENLLNK